MKLGEEGSTCEIQITTKKHNTAVADVSSFQIVIEGNQGEILDKEEIYVYDPVIGMKSSYLFTYTAPVDIEKSDTIWIDFPMEYDPHVGKIWKTYNDPTKKYQLKCSSSVFQEIKCWVSHWRVLITGLSLTAKDNKIDIQIESVYNPLISTSDNFRLFQITSSGIVSAYDKAFGTVAFSLEEGLINFKSVESGVDKLNTYTATTFLFSFSGELANEDMISVEFPDLYSLELTDINVYLCNLIITDQDLSTTEVESTCSLENNSIKLILILSTILSVVESDTLQLTINEAKSPQ